MKRRITYLIAVVILLVGILAFAYFYYGPIFDVHIGPEPTSIFSGNVDLELINKLRATQPYGEIGREQAIGLAELYCMQINNSPNQENPSHIQAFHLIKSQAMRRLNVDQESASSSPVWLVSMDGSWEHEGGPVPPSTNTPPLIFHHCTVIINAITGEFDGGTN
jgi:hypothetical protein